MEIKKYAILIVSILSIAALVCLGAWNIGWLGSHGLASQAADTISLHTRNMAKDSIPNPKPKVKKTKLNITKQPAQMSFRKISGVVRDTSGAVMKGVVISDSYSCTQTDSQGYYQLNANPQARFVYYTVPADCEVPTHSPTDNTANFYLPLSANRTRYDFVLRRLPHGKEHDYRMIVFGDPQVTNSFSPYYIDNSDNSLEKSDVARFTDETMSDVKRGLELWPSSLPVYGLSMGDDVQYYGGYNPSLELQIRQVLGSSRMRVFSVIGNHDQDGKAIYQRKWEDVWGPTDYSFDRGDEHYVCFNNVKFVKGKGYYQPGELAKSQLRWLEADLELVPRHKKVILCYHIPFTMGTSPSSHAVPLALSSEKGHYHSACLTSILRLLKAFRGGYELFCGHTHFAINHEIDTQEGRVLEHCHAAACGAIWQANINICGTPNGYYVYHFSGTGITDAWYKGTNWARNQQMSIFYAGTDFNGESYSADWHLPAGDSCVVANVFNADSRWHVVAIENGVETPMSRLSGKGQDAFATGYLHKYSKSISYHFVSKSNSYLLMNHLYVYEPKTLGSQVMIRATDPYGNVYTGSVKDAVRDPFSNYAHFYNKIE